MAAAPLKVSDLYRFLEAKGAKWECPSCGHRGHGAIVDEVAENARLSLLSYPFPDHNVLNTGNWDVIGLACSNCAHIRLFAHTPIATWAAENPPN